MRKAGIKVRRASPDFLDLASPNMDRIMVAVRLFRTRVCYQCGVRLALRAGSLCTVATSVGIHTIPENFFTPRRKEGAKAQRKAAQIFGIKM
jgi:hypothetical protein